MKRSISSHKTMIFAVVLVLCGAAVAASALRQGKDAQDTLDKVGQNQNVTLKANKPTPSPTVNPAPPAQPQLAIETVISTNLTSPDGSYTVEAIPQQGDGFGFNIKDRSGRIIAADIPTDEDQKAMGFGTKILPQYGLHFGGWTSGSRFAWKINNAEDHEYQYIVDASTGKADLATYKQIR